MHGIARLRGWTLGIVLTCLLIVHVLLVYRLSSRTALGAAVLGVVFLVLITHLGALSRLISIFRRRAR